MSNLIELHGMAWLTSKQAADLLGVSIEYIHKLVYQRLLRKEKVGNALLLHREDVEQYKRDHPALGKTRYLA